MLLPISPTPSPEIISNPEAISNNECTTPVEPKPKRKRTYNELIVPYQMAVNTRGNPSTRMLPGSLTSHEQLLDLATNNDTSTSQQQVQGPCLGIWPRCFEVPSKNSSYVQIQSGPPQTDTVSTQYVFQNGKRPIIHKHLKEHGCTADEFMLLITGRNKPFHAQSIGNMALHFQKKPELLQEILSKVQTLAIDNKEDYRTAILQAMRNDPINVAPQKKACLARLLKGIEDGKVDDTILTHHETARASHVSITKVITSLKKALNNKKITQARIDELVAYYRKPENTLKNPDWLYTLIKISSLMENPQTDQDALDVLNAASPQGILMLIKANAFTCPAHFFHLVAQKKSLYTKKTYSTSLLEKYAKQIKKYRTEETCRAIVQYLGNNICVSQEHTQKLISILDPTHNADKQHSSSSL
jgi:hypothetical protein